MRCDVYRLACFGLFLLWSVLHPIDMSLVSL